MTVKNAYFLSAWIFCTAWSQSAVYYIDFDTGRDDSSGISAETPFKHSPGDPQAGGKAGSVKLEPGDTILFKGGAVYRGSIQLPGGGAPGNRITFKGDGWGNSRAIIDGSDLLTGWQRCTTAAEAGGNPDYQNLFFTKVPSS
jgi:hypothetical protein